MRDWHSHVVLFDSKYICCCNEFMLLSTKASNQINSIDLKNINYQLLAGIRCWLSNRTRIYPIMGSKSSVLCACECVWTHLKALKLATAFEARRDQVRRDDWWLCTDLSEEHSQMLLINLAAIMLSEITNCLYVRDSPRDWKLLFTICYNTLWNSLLSGMR